MTGKSSRNEVTAASVESRVSTPYKMLDVSLKDWKSGETAFGLTLLKNLATVFFNFERPYNAMTQQRRGQNTASPATVE